VYILTNIHCIFYYVLILIGNVEKSFVERYFINCLYYCYKHKSDIDY